MRSSPRCIIESLEPRQLFSAAAPILAVPAATAHPAIAIYPTGTGVTLHLQAGVGFTGEVAFIPSPASGLGPSARIDWGDGTTTSATLQVTTQAGVTGYDVIGSHTYADPGTYSIGTSMLLTPIGIPGQPTPQFIVVEPTVISTAIVAGPIVQSTAGVTIQEIAGTRFTADLGSFVTGGPGTRLRATINWGDGKTSVGRLVAGGAVGEGELTFAVAGGHKYRNAGTYGIAINVIQLPVGASLAIANIASFDAIAVVSAKPAK